jgi:hypothetical protein
MRWTKAMRESGGVDIAAEIRMTLAKADTDEDNGTN